MSAQRINADTAQHFADGDDRTASKSNTPHRILQAALQSFVAKGYEASSLDAIAASSGIRKQTVLYWFSSKERLMEAVVQYVADQLTQELAHAVALADTPFSRIERVVKAVFQLAARRPDLIGFLREAGRQGSPCAEGLRTRLRPIADSSAGWLTQAMNAGHFRHYDASFFLLSAYSMVVGVASERETQEAIGMTTALRSLVRRRNDVVRMLRLALVPTDMPT